MKKLIVLAFVFLTSCAAQNPVERQLNRSLLFDTGVKLGGNLSFLPFPLPEFDFGFRINLRHPSIQEEVDLNLSKVGKWREQGSLPPPPPAAPQPFSATTPK